MADKRPDKSIKIESLDNKEIKMSYTLFNDLLRFVGTMDEAMSSILTSQDTRDLVLRRVLTDSDKPVEDVKDLIPVEDIEIDVFEIEDILGWVMDHVTYFFMKTAVRLKTGAEKFPEVAKAIKTSSSPSETGTQP